MSTKLLTILSSRFRTHFRFDKFIDIISWVSDEIRCAIGDRISLYWYRNFWIGKLFVWHRQQFKCVKSYENCELHFCLCRGKNCEEIAYMKWWSSKRGFRAKDNNLRQKFTWLQISGNESNRLELWSKSTITIFNKMNIVEHCWTLLITSLIRSSFFLIKLIASKIDIYFST